MSNFTPFSRKSYIEQSIARSTEIFLHSNYLVGTLLGNRDKIMNTV